MAPRSALTILRVAALYVGGAAVLAGPASPQVRESLLAGIPASVRSAGLQGAGVALVGGAGSVFTNPAGIATIRRMAVEGGYQAAPFDGSIASGAMGWRLRQFDVGFGIQRFDLGATPLVGLPTGAPNGARELLAVGSLVYRFGIIALGASGKYTTQDIVSEQNEAVSADLGMAIALFDIMALGFGVQNVGGNWRDSNLELARLTRTGFTMNYVDPQGTVRLLSTIELQWPQGRGQRVVLGGEGGLAFGEIGVLGRLAYKSGADSRIGSGMTYGATVGFGSMDVDFAYEPNDLVDDPSYRMGVRIAF